MEKQKYGFGIASLVLGLVSLVSCCTMISIVPAIIGLILGIIALNTKNHNKSLSTAGVVLSSIACLLSIIMIMFTFFTDDSDSDSNSESESAIESENHMELQEDTESVEVSEDEEDEDETEYKQVTADELIDLVGENPLKAEKTYNYSYLEITGRVDVIDSDGEYISLGRVDGEFSLDNITCYVTDDSQLDQIVEMSMDDIVVIRVQITDIGEIIGYNADIIEILE